MLGLPKSTEYGKRIPKQKFYENLTVSPALKRVFVEQIKAVTWQNKIAPATMNLAAGEEVQEIEVFEIKLAGPDLDVAVLRQIDKEIPYHILFLLEYEGEYQAWISFKESSASGSNAFKVGTYYHTEWMLKTELPIKVDGFSTDAVYENFVRQIAGEALQTYKAESLKESVERDIRRQELKKQIAMLEAKIRKEKQLNKQVEMNAELKHIKIDLEGLR